ncbi:hypothetical protein EHM76_00160 [bacterium]|nr:MAG: hypothetical protein EHM76_00160 [bacterium]
MNQQSLVYYEHRMAPDRDVCLRCGRTMKEIVEDGPRCALAFDQEVEHGPQIEEGDDCDGRGTMITPQDLRDHATDEHTRGCNARGVICTCGYDKITERLLRAAAKRIEELEATARGYRERDALKREGERDE